MDQNVIAHLMETLEKERQAHLKALDSYSAKIAEYRQVIEQLKGGKCNE